MKMFFYTLICLVLLAFFGSSPAKAEGAQQDCDRACELNKQARARELRAFNGELICIHFTLPRAGAKVTLQVFGAGEAVIEDSKEIPTREGKFCYPRSRWLKAGPVPEKIRLCSEHSVTLRSLAEMKPVFSGNKGRVNNTSYACLRGIAGCGGRDNVSIPRDKLDK